MFCPFYTWEWSDSERLDNFQDSKANEKQTSIGPQESLIPKPMDDDDNIYHLVSNYLSKCFTPLSSHLILRWYLWEDRWVVNKHIKRFSKSLVIRETQIKTTVRYHFTPNRMAVIKNKTGNIKHWWGCGETGTLVHC